MAEGGGLLNRYTLSRRIEGSNPSVSAKISDLRDPLGGAPEATKNDLALFWLSLKE